MAKNKNKDLRREQKEKKTEVDPVEIQEDLIKEETDPDIIPEDDPYETPPYIIPEPGEGP